MTSIHCRTCYSADVTVVVQLLLFCCQTPLVIDCCLHIIIQWGRYQILDFSEDFHLLVVFRC